MEQDAEALATWRKFSPVRPTLLLLSDELVSSPIPEEIWPRAADLLSRGTTEEIARRGSVHHPDPLLLPGMAVDAALRSGWFGKVVWVLPLREANKPLTADDLRRKLLDHGLVTAAEAETFTARDQRISGALRGVPLIATPLPHLPALTGPTVIHIDQSYFQRMYKNEVATPLLPLVQETLLSLQKRKVPALAATFCSGNIDGRIPLDVRFVGEFLAEHFEAPGTLDQPLQPKWQRHGEAIYLSNFFQKERIRQLNLVNEKEAPASAWVKFALFRSAVDHREGTAALNYLAETVALDPVYALEYLDLADMAHEKKRPDEALRMLRLAAKALPEIPRLRLKIAQLSYDLGEVKGALEEVEALRKLPWSPIYYPDVPPYLAGFASSLRNPLLQPPPPSSLGSH